jgi:hypothetical protein
MDSDDVNFDVSLKRFSVPSEEELEKLVENRQSMNTKKSTSVAINCLRDFCLELKRPTEFEKIEKEDLAGLLLEFYAGARNKHGELYKKSTLNSIRFGLARYFKAVKEIDIIYDPVFTRSNVIFKAQSIELKKCGKGSINHYPELEPEDLRKIYTSINVASPLGLQQKVWMDIMLYLIRRGRENLCKMTKQTFSVGKDAAGQTYITQKEDELDKTHRGSDAADDTVGEGKMYECPGNVKTYIYE